MAEPKTRRTRASVQAFLDALPDPTQRRDCLVKRLADIDIEALRELLTASVATLRAHHG